MSKFYITTPIYYVNAGPHLGNSYTTIAADVAARYHRLIGDDTFFLVGTDEHSEKNEQAAIDAQMKPQDFVDKISAEFRLAWKSLSISNDRFIRTTEEEHKRAVQKALQYMYDKGIVYKGYYEGLYCVGCAQYKTEKDLVGGLCPDHQREPVVMKEESYLFKLSAFADQLKEQIEKDELLIRPIEKKNEVLAFYEQGLRDISFSRKSTSWGVEIPWDKEHVFYVWPDAFLNYLTGLGWDGTPGKVPERYPPDVQFMAKDIIRVHATIWPAMLLALNLPLPKEMFVHGYFVVDGQKMSKTIGNVILPDELIAKYGVDATRYLLMSTTPFGHDGDIGWGKFDEKYTADLANGLGNLVSRVTNLIDKSGLDIKADRNSLDQELKKQTDGQFADYRFDDVLKLIWQKITESDVLINNNKPWVLIKDIDGNKEKLQGLFTDLANRIYNIAYFLQPFLPETAGKIIKNIALDKIKKSDILFPRLLNKHEFVPGRVSR